MFYTVGIDVGAKGSLCLLREDMKYVEFSDFEDNDMYWGKTYSLLGEISSYDIRMIILEKVHAMPKQGVTSMFSFGINYGKWQMLLELAGTAHRLVTPQEWQKGVKIPTSFPKGTPAAKRKSLVKTSVKDTMSKLFPNAELFGKKGGYLDGRGDSLAMAYYARQLYLKGG
jgi:hypothetical protein